MRICFIGDSFVNGTGDPECLGWSGRICIAAKKSGCDLTYYNLGIRGNTTQHIIERWQAESKSRLPAEHDGKIVFSFGTNDTTIEAGKRRIELDDSLNNTRQILSLAQQKYPVIMVSPPPIADVRQNLRTQELLTQIELVCQDLKVPYLDVFTPLQASQVWMTEIATGDGAHPSAAGYSELANLVQNWSVWSDWIFSK
ncbi:GDSL-type esterase/lipase family protein [Merismopedia glauca]|uniref:Lipase n=1 Tax=Merismopedia glauca CCAP 1448/3 TaxID=1296344 RepID=A0A2T1CAC3_9CYAN|nr:GDSL-type esterase/lipase family protein [Merismopedia glauca]PSB05202.1 lipase [Merismopedia glauca CCAP 1448/3]